MEVSWTSLPSVIFVKILSYLNFKDRLNATSACRAWRYCLEDPKTWKNVSLKLKPINYRHSKKVAYLCGKFCQDVLVEFDSRQPSMVRDFIYTFKYVAENFSLQHLAIKPSSFRLEWPERTIADPRKLLLSLLLQALQTARSLRSLSLGCLEELTENSDKILFTLLERQSGSLEVLHLASVKENPDRYELPDVPLDSFASLANLRILSVDYDYVNNMLLQTFCQYSHRRLEKLIIHVHGIEPGREKICNSVWAQLTRGNPSLEVTLNLVHSYDGSVNLLDILQPAMPLAHLRMFFCQHLNIAAIDFITQQMSETFKSVHVVEGMLDPETPLWYQYDTDENPFVMLAWKCRQLIKFILIGYVMELDDLVAIARLRGNSLQKMSVPQCCVATRDHTYGGEYWRYGGHMDEGLLQQVSNALGRKWDLLKNDELPAAVFEAHADCEEAYLPILLADQRL